MHRPSLSFSAATQDQALVGASADRNFVPTGLANLASDGLSFVLLRREFAPLFDVLSTIFARYLA
jgi:hypothetical protein